MDKPRVSVILPVYNGEDYVASAIESVLAQSHDSFELLICNDGSRDNSDDVIRRYIGDERIRYINRENRGLGQTLNELVDCAQGELIARMDADDICHPERLVKQEHLLSRCPDVAMCGTDYSFLVDHHTLPSRGVLTDPGAIKRALFHGSFPICHPTLMFRRHIFLAVGGYHLRGCGEDLDMFLRFSEMATITNVDEVLFSYRLHEGSLAASSGRKLALGYAYALACANRRKDGLVEPTLDAYIADSTPFKKLYLQAYATWFAVSEKFNRRSLIAAARNQELRSTIFLAATALLRPRAALRRVKQKLST